MDSIHNTADFEHHVQKLELIQSKLAWRAFTSCSQQSCKLTILISSAKKRAIYDQFGEEGLKGGVPEKGS